MDLCKRLAIFSFFITVLSFLASCSSTPELPSKWKHSEIIVDGIDTEWQQDMSYFEKEKVAIGMKNDGDNFYLAIKTIDLETQQKMVRGGMTVWFDPKGGDKKTFGIHFPLGNSAAGGAPIAPTHVRGSREAVDPTNDYSAVEDRLKKMLQNLEIIGPGPVDKEQIPVSSSFLSRGIKVSIRDTMGTVFYELVVPLKITKQKPLAIGADTGRTIGVGVITDDMRRSMTAAAPDEGAPNGGYGKPGMGGGGSGMGGRRGGGGGGGRSRQNAETATPLELWMKVKVASGN